MNQDKPKQMELPKNHLAEVEEEEVIRTNDTFKVDPLDDDVDVEVGPPAKDESAENILDDAGAARGIKVLYSGVQDWKFMSCSHVKSWVNLLTWLLIGCSLLCSRSEVTLLADTTLDNDYNS